MAFIRINELRPAGSELFQDSESFLNELSDADTMSVNGGGFDSSGFDIFGALLFKGYDKKLDFEVGLKKIEAGYLLNVIGAIVDIGSKYSKGGGISSSIF